MKKTKQWISMILVCLALAIVLPTQAQAAEVASGTCGDNLTWTLTDDGVLTISGTGAMTDYASSSAVPWYSRRYSITEVVIGDNVTSIGNNAFYNYTNLESVRIGSGIESIGNNAFYYCTSLASVTIPDSVTSIGNSAFESCASLENVTIPNSVQSIGNNAFHSCTSLASVSIGSSVQSIGDSAFYNCTSLASVTIPDSVTTIGTVAFCRCTNLASVTIGKSVESIGFAVFYGCTSLESISVDANNTAFSSLDGVLFNKDQTVLLAYPAGKTELTYTIPGTVTTIDMNAFATCANLVGVTIPDSMESIGECAFEGCTALATVTFVGTEEQWAEITINGGNSPLTSASLITIVASGTCGDNLTWTLTTDGVLAISGTGAMADYDVNAPWYDYRASITEVVIGDGVTSIGSCAFHTCYNLTEITIPSSVTSIGYEAFSNCNNLKSISVSSSNTVYSSLNGVLFNKDQTTILCYPSGKTEQTYTIPVGVTSIHEDAFFSCKNLTNVTIPNGVTTIGKYAFYNCTALESIEIPSSVTSIGDYAFYYCRSLTSAAIGNGVQSIGRSAFNNCSSLASISIPDSVTSIGGGTFSGCTSLTSIIIPDSVTSIGNSVFGDCTSLVSATISDSVTSISDSAFYNCSSLASILIPDGVTNISYSAFKNCSSLASISIPGSMTNIDPYAFYGCEALKTVYYGSTEKNWAKITVQNSNDPLLNAEIIFSGPKVIDSGTCGENLTWSMTDDGTLIISGTGEMANYDYENPVPWLDHKYAITAVVISDGVTSIGAYAFEYCSRVVSIEISDSVTSIGEYAFAECYDLAEIEIPASVTIIGKSVFAFCKALTGITVHENNPNYCSADGVLFNKDQTVLIQYPHKKSDTSYVIPDSVVCIGENAFQGCSELTSITIPYGVTSIGDNAFDRASITSIVIPDSVTSIGYAAFLSCTNLTSVAIPNSVTSVGSQLFSYCSSLTSATVGNGITDGGISMFESCTNLSSVAIADGATLISGGMFQNCTSLTNIVIPNSVTSIGSSAFINCTNLADLTIPDSVTTIESSVFSGCTSLTSVTIPDSVTLISWYAFDGCTSLTTVYYGGSKTQWSGISINDGNDNLLNANILFAQTELAAPEIAVSINSANGKPRVTWDAVDGAEKYEVWRSTSKDGTYTKTFTTSGTVYTNTSAVVGTTYYYKVRAVSGEMCSEFSEVKSITCLSLTPVITVTVLADSGKPMVTWEAVQGATKYEVYRSTSKDGTYVKALTTTGTKYTNTGAVPGTTYYYKVRAIVGSSSHDSSICSATCTLAKPSASVALNAACKPRVTWNAVPGATKYEIYRSTSENGTYAKAFTTTGTVYTNTSAVEGTTYYYKVVAICDASAAGNSVPSEVVSVTCISLFPVINVTVYDSGKPVVTWNAVPGATKYEIYRSTSENGTYTRMFTTTGTKYTNTNAVAGTNYYYKVRAIVGSYTYDSAIGSATCMLARPVVTIALNDNDKPRLTWNAVTGAAKYEVWRSTSLNGNYVKTFTTTGTTYNNTSAVAGTTYYYMVVAVCSANTAGNSAFSEIKSITCPSYTPVITVAVNADSGKPTITWDAVDGATKYEVYRSTSKDGTYVKALTTTGTKYTNTSAVAGTTYYYKVRAIIGTSSYDSAIGSATCKLARPVVTITVNSSGKPRLTWNAVDGAVKYEVYRSTSLNGTYTKTFTTTGTTYNNTNAVAGTTYYYKVIAICEVTAGNSAYSVIQSVTAE